MNTADDPTTLSSLPPRHALESDSEEDDDPAFPLPHSSRRQRTKPGPVELRITGWQSERDSATLLVLGGEAAGKFVDGYDGQDAGEVVRVDGVKEEIVGLLSTIGPDLVVLVLKPELPHALPSPIALAVLDTISPARVVALDSYIASSYLPSAEEEATRTLAEDDSDGEERLRFLATSSAYKPATGLHPFSPPNHLLSSVAPFLTLLPLSEPPTPLFLLPAPRPTLATLRRLANVLREELGETAAWDEARFVKGGRKNRWGRKEVDAGSMYM